MLGSLPFFHAFGYTITLWLPLMQGFGAVFHPNPMEAQAIGELARNITRRFCSPRRHSAWRTCASALPSSSRIRFVLTGAEKMRPELAEAFREKFGIAPLEGYGCTEMGPVVSVNRWTSSNAAAADGNRPGSAGRPIPASPCASSIRTPWNASVKGAGLLLVNGPGHMTGYLDDPERTGEALAGGYYITGDIARMDSDGFVFIMDRVSRFSKIGGEMVPHLRVEEALRECSGTRRA